MTVRRGYWDDIWFRVAAQSWIQDARTEFSRLIAGYDGNPEDLAREVSYECAPMADTDVEGLADLCPQVWEKADEFDEGPGTEWGALRWAIAYLIFEELFDLHTEGCSPSVLIAPAAGRGRGNK